VWTRGLNKRLGKGVVAAPVVRFGRIDVLWTAEPNARDVGGCTAASGPTPEAGPLDHEAGRPPGSGTVVSGFRGDDAV